ncbi:MAG: type II toxin-antitoxin system VapC family toxin [Fimbriimonadaceae bacterium]|nr:type II toxin-antitoxin system VapC family toxin [Fimbriimonadaceae bacterium]
MLLDTSVLARLCDPDPGLRQRAQHLLLRLSTGGCALAICPQVVYEFWVVATRPTTVNGMGLDPSEASAQIGDWLAAFQMLHDLPEAVPIWRRLVSQMAVLGKSAHDARLVSTAIAHGVARVSSFNRADFERYADLIVIED